jgi:hypothetical protein
MKRILFSSVLLVLLHFTGLSAPFIANDTKCAIQVTVNCYDNCVLVGSVSVTIPANSSAPIPACNNGNYRTFTVCWVNDGKCHWPPPVPCVTVDGSNPPAPPPCSPGTYTGTITSCDVCTATGKAAIKFDILTGNLLITP